jgi:hypothetical protein
VRAFFESIFDTDEQEDEDEDKGYGDA